MTFPGGKAGAGVYQAIINQMPPHNLYIEPFVGGGAVLLHKRPARESYIFDLDDESLTAISDEARRRRIPVTLAQQSCGVAYLERCGWNDSQTLVYCDPPYVMRTRTKQRIYAHEMTDADHMRLLAAVKRLDCLVLLSGYDNLLYRAELADWRLVTFTGQTRGGPREECLWCNFPEPQALHDYRYVGENFRERERIAKKVARAQRNFAALPVLERRAILSALLRIDRPQAPPPDPAMPESSTAGDDGGSSGSSGGFSPISSGCSTTTGDELSEKHPDKAGFPQSGPIDASGDARSRTTKSGVGIHA